jgi:large subunit ribosomal protein L28
MSRKCEVTNKRFGKGRVYKYRGIAKYKGGIGLNITGSCKRQHKINIMKQKIWSPEENRFITLKLSAHGLKIIDKVGIDTVLRRIKQKKLQATK